MRLAWSFPLLLSVACTTAAPAEEPVEPGDATSGDEATVVETSDPRAFAVEVDGGALVLPAAAGEAGALTLLGPGGACVGQVMGDGPSVAVAGCPASPVPWVAIAAESPASWVPSERVDAPSVDAEAPYAGRFGDTGFGFRLESPEGDGLCPGSPTTITFVEGDRVLGSTTVEAPITRSGSEGVMGLTRVDGLLAVVIVWGPNARRVVTLTGTTLLDGTVAHTEPCDCCTE